MYYFLRILFVTIICFLLSSIDGNAASKVLTIDLWPKGAPDKSQNLNDTAKLYVYLPERAQMSGRAIVICPGGWYSDLNIENEGKDWAGFFNAQGIAVVVLKYRMPFGNSKIPLEDAMEAIRVVRNNAEKWHISPSQVGIMGFSSGGHLASLVATLGKNDASPNFQILFYPIITMEDGFTHKETHDNFLGDNPRKKVEREYSSDRLVSRVTPRAFIALCDDDRDVLPANGVNYYLACYRHDVPATLHVFPEGGHGWGMKQIFPFYIEMLQNLKAWLDSF